MVDLEQWFVDGCNNPKIDSNGKILNWYRNLYYKENEGTERRIIAEALNGLFMDLQDRGIDLESL